MSEKGIHLDKKTKVQQHFKDETNINNIVRRFNTGEMPMGNQSEPMYMDNTKFGDYTEMLNQVTGMKQEFMKIDPKIRARFQNQPAQYLEFIQNDENLEEAEKIGLVPPGTYKAPKKEKTPEKGSAPAEPPNQPNPAEKGEKGD